LQYVDFVPFSVICDYMVRVRLGLGLTLAQTLPHTHFGLRDSFHIHDLGATVWIYIGTVVSSAVVVRFLGNSPCMG
jgi:hypothetical protein